MSAELPRDQDGIVPGRPMEFSRLEPGGSTLQGSGEWSTGWPMLFASFVGVGTTWIFFQLIAGLFIVPMQAEFGWGRAELSLGSWAGFGSALLLPVVGVMIDRIGARRVAIGGMIALTAGFLLLSQLGANRPAYFALVAWMSVAGSASNSVIFARGLATWFRRGFGTAVGIMMSGPSVAAAIGTPVISSIIAAHGWRAGFLAIAAFLGFFGLPIILMLFRQRRDSVGLRAAKRKAPYRLLVRFAPLWWLVAATAAAALPIGGFLAHLQPILGRIGLPRAEAAGFGSVFAISIGAGRLVLGPLLDRFYAPVVTASSLVLAAVGAAVFWWLGTGLINSALFAGIALIGLAQGAEADYLKFFAARLFEVGLFGRIAAILSTVASAGMGLGGLMFGLIFDRFGNYEAVFPVSLALYFLSAFCFLQIRMTPFEEGGEA